MLRAIDCRCVAIRWLSNGGHRRKRKGLLGTATAAISRQSAALLEPLFAAGSADSTAAAAAGWSFKVGLEYTAATVAAEVQVVRCVLWIVGVL
jgi:hypothetical protein